MIKFDEFKLKTTDREVLIDITNDVRNIIRKYDVEEGVCRIFIPHTTAGVTINENADPSVIKDISNYLSKLIPKGGGLGYSYRHGEGNSDAHIKCSLTGHSVDILIHDKRLMLGTWQGIMLAEYDGPRNRRVYVQIQGE
ncbi:MAG: secondary thiamine-phosphate synthase enzyme YjbQ [Candidatus Odinarchaeota archaeon]